MAAPGHPDLRHHPLGSRVGRATFERFRGGVRPELVAVLLLAAVLDLWSLSANGDANEYYAAAVRSMAGSSHAFLFGSFDPTGVMTVDKPPLALWVQAASADLFGFSPWSILVPQAVMGVLTVGLSYALVGRRFGRLGGAAAALVLALTPITVAISRHNNPDALLILCSVGALWAVARGLEDGRTRWLVLAGVLVGLGFEAKMAAALTILPGIVLAWCWVAPRGRLRSLLQLSAFAATAVVVGLAWPVVVWLTPAGDRPWVSGTDDNSVWSLIFGYNGVGRLFGQAGAPGTQTLSAPGGGEGIFGGPPGPFRLVDAALGGQSGWLLGAAVAAGVAILLITRLRRVDPRTGWLIAVGGAAAVTAAAFSKASGIFHPYYVSLLAPLSAAVVGAGVGIAGGRAVPGTDRDVAPWVPRLLGPALIGAGLLTEVVVIHDGAPDLHHVGWIAGSGAAACGAVLALRLAPAARPIVIAAAGALLLVPPGVWAVDTLGHPTDGTYPTGGPAPVRVLAAARPTPPRGPSTGRHHRRDPARLSTVDALRMALAYAGSHGGGVVAVPRQQGAAAFEIIHHPTAEVAGIGGFSGRESRVGRTWFANAVQAGRIRFVLFQGTSGTNRVGRVGAGDILALTKAAGRAVHRVPGLYDLRDRARVLRTVPVPPPRRRPS